MANLNIFDTFPTILIYENRLNVDMDVDIFLNKIINVKTYLYIKKQYYWNVVFLSKNILTYIPFTDVENVEII